MASLAPYSITLGGTDYPAKYAGLLAYIEPFLTNLETFSFSGGNVGLGVTPSAWRSGAKALQVGGFASLNTQQNGTVTLAFGAYESGSNTFSYLTTGDAPTAYSQITGQHRWFNAPSGTAGNAISWAQAMTLDASGQLQIGTTTANAKLTVSGSVSWTTGASFAGASGNTAWATGFGSQAISTSIQASDSIAGANIYAISDVRLKSNIKPIPSGLAFVKEVSAVQFTWNESGIEDTGFIAQDLLKKGFGHLVSAIPDGAMKELVHDDGNVSPAGSRFVVKYDSVVPILCKAIQEQQALIENLLARVAALEQP
jgi:hypothetical protein